MSRPHGNSATAQARDSVSSTTFASARSSLVNTLENLSFVKVVAVQVGPSSYTGEAVEIHFRDSKERPKSVFFDKFGRSRTNLTIGSMNISQAPLGLDHPSATPTVGEVLLGSLVPNTRRSHLDFVLRGWTSDATPLKELLRILKFGTKLSEFEVRNLLIQPAALLMRAPETIKKSRDDIYMTARIILWSSLRPLQVLASIQESWELLSPASDEELEMAKNIRISSKATEFIDALVIKFNDSQLSESFASGLIIPAAPPPPPTRPEPINTFKYMSSEVPADTTPPYAPHSPSAEEYDPRYPPSPRYVPSSPNGNKTPEVELYGDL
jgi:hypothetical protein